MERLTKRVNNGKVGYALLGPGECVDVIDLLHVWGDRLAAYEDAMPIERAQEIAQAKKDGRLEILPPNDPLTLEQLREMEGDKIYVHYINGFYTDEDGAYFGKFEQLVRECNGKLTACELPLEYYGKTWFAYRRKPDEGTT